MKILLWFQSSKRTTSWTHTEGTCGRAGREATARGEEGIAEQSDVHTQGGQREVIGNEILYGLRRLTVHETRKKQQLIESRKGTKACIDALGCKRSEDNERQGTTNEMQSSWNVSTQ